MPITVTFEEWIVEVDKKSEDLKLNRDDYYKTMQEG